MQNLWNEIISIIPSSGSCGRVYLHHSDEPMTYSVGSASFTSRQLLSPQTLTGRTTSHWPLDP
jgi:hypothetical protein